jgi:hypothetical protein
VAEAFFVLARPERRFGGFEGQMVRVLGGIATSRELAPGPYVMIPASAGAPLLAEELEIRAGETTLLTWQVPRAVERSVRFAAPDAGRFVDVAWHDARGTLLSLRRTTAEPGLQRQAFVPGTYEVEVSGVSGKSVKATFVVEDRDAPGEELVLPVPW